MNDLAGAVPLHCQALAIRLSIGVPQAEKNNIARLRDLRTKLGDTNFSVAARTVFDERSFMTLIAILDQTG